MAKQSKFGTFGGVFVPSILTILGVIMYLRLPMIIGEAGLWATLGIILVAHIISATTGLSVSSIATDKKVEAGGTYYMISRSMGLPIGGTLGLALFVGLSFSVSLYLIGFSESFLSYFGFSTDINNIRLTGTLVLLAVTTLTFISTSLAIKTQYFIMAAIVLSLVSILIGRDEAEAVAVSIPKSGPAVSLMVLFGIFFPAVTGFEAGVSMSGDLKDPKKSIPQGSILAIVIGFAVYIGLSFFLYNTVDISMLANDPKVLLNIAWVPELVLIGILGATLSSALGSILGAPRIMQAIAADKIAPKIFAKGYGATNEPRNALLLTFLIAEAGILIGELDVIARIVSIFFITTYGFLNISAAFERWTSADFRPEFKVPGWVSIIGALACIIVMIQLDFVAMIGAIVLLGLLFLFLKRKELTLESGDAWSGVWASLVKSGLTHLKKEKLHKRNWRPNIIMFSGNPNVRRHMVEIGEVISGRLGVLSAFELVKSDAEMLTKPHSNLLKEKNGISYFQHKLHCRDYYAGMDEIARVYGFSGVEPNTILLGWSQQEGYKEPYVNLLKSFKFYGYNTVLLKFDEELEYGDQKNIDVWWNGVGRNLSLAIHLIRSISSSKIWKRATVRLCITISDALEAENVYLETSNIIDQFREEIEIATFVTDEQTSTKEVIKKESERTDLVIIGLQDGQYDDLEKYMHDMDDTLSGLGSSLIINASSNFEGFDVISGSENKTKWSDIVAQGDLELSLPELGSSIFPEVHRDMIKMDENGLKMISHFYKSTIKPIVDNNLSMLNELLDRINQIAGELEKINEIPDSYRKIKAVDKLNIDILFKVNELVSTQFKDEILPHHIACLDEGLNGYSETLFEEFKRFPRALRVMHDKADFKIIKGDPFSLKFYKASRLLINYLTGGRITHKLNYRELARHYQLHSRQLFLNEFLKKFKSEESIFYDRLRKVTNNISTCLNQLEAQCKQGLSLNEDDQLLTDVTDIIREEIAQERKMSLLYLGRLQYEFRDNLRNMIHDMDQVQIKSSQISERPVSKKAINSTKSEISDFTTNYESLTTTKVNMILMELAINTVKNRSEDLLRDFYLNLHQIVKSKCLNPIQDVKSALGEQQELNDIQDAGFNDSLESELKLSFNDTLDKLYDLLDNMPESFEIYSIDTDTGDASEVITIPVRRMTEYYLKSQYELTSDQVVKELIDSINRSVFTIKDQVSLTQFSQANTDDKPSKKKYQELIETCEKTIDQEKEVITDKVDQFIKQNKELFESSFEPLSSLKIQDSASEFVYGLRNYQGKQVLSGASNLMDKVREWSENIAIKVLYGRSKSILFTKKFTRNDQPVSTNSSLLSLVEKVGPYEDAIKLLPPYYVTLFNGKSSISRDFWVERKTEQTLLQKARDRYLKGYHGGVLVLGERNSGKTVFCRYAIQKVFKNKTIYTVFPPLQGTCTVAGFTKALKVATQETGTVHQILNKVPDGSVLVINDIELFWENTEKGHEIINLLRQLMDDYSDKVFFVINCNPHAYKVLNDSVQFGAQFLEIINFSPFDATELKDLILRRHMSSGLNLGYVKQEKALSDVQLAQLFNYYFDYSEGNPGTALSGWFNHVCKVTNERLVLEKPVYPDVASLKEINDVWKSILVQFVLHKRLTVKRLTKVTDLETSDAKSHVLALKRAGVLIEKSSGVLHIDSNLLPFLVRSFKDCEAL